MDNSVNATNNAQDDDVSFIKAFQTGDKSAFDKLVLKYQDKIFNLCFRFLGDHEDTNDCAQEIFLKVFKALKKFRFESTFFTWLYRITINTCETRSKSLEHKYRKRTVSIDNPGTIGNLNLSMNITDNCSSPIEKLEQKERKTLIQDAINSLSSDHKIVIILRDIEQLSYEEIAITIGFDLGTVKSRLSRARIELRKILERVMGNGMF
jgi:RNA polymerase sigma-70 factor (ECF subfamily)